VTPEVRRIVRRIQCLIDDLAEDVDAQLHLARLIQADLEDVRREAPEVCAKALAWHQKHGRRRCVLETEAEARERRQLDDIAERTRRLEALTNTQGARR
jgi:hypothetical protein